MDCRINSAYHRLIFKRPSGTSRGILRTKDSWVLSSRVNGINRYGEASIIDGLSMESAKDVEQYLAKIHEGVNIGPSYPSSIRFGLETLELSAQGEHPFELLECPFYTKEQPIKINGLIWMGDKQYMYEQIKDKIKQGFDCIKMKIGAIDFEEELNLIKFIRSHYSKQEVELRVDANGAFHIDEALEKLKRLSDYDIHSIEQPIRTGQWESMASLCEANALDIALDEELIGDYYSLSKKRELLKTIKPQYIILKPSLIGGLKQSDEWIKEAEELEISWWATSALESNIGLNAIAQWVSAKANKLPQGLGTGQLYENNIQSPLQIREGHLTYNHSLEWELSNVRGLS